MSSERTDPENYPLGTLVYYGPDDQTVTKIAASVFDSPVSEPIRQHWSGENVTKDRVVLSELGQFFKEHRVKKVVMTDHVAGCPHEEGIDYPAGEACPMCPFWKEKQFST